MIKMTMTNTGSEIRKAAAGFGFRTNGIKTTDLLDQVNAKIDELIAIEEAAKANTKPAKTTLESLGFTENQVVYISGRKVKGEKLILAGRQMFITKVSDKPGFVNGFLVHEKLGTPQKTLIAIPAEVLVAITTQIAVAQ